MQPMLNVDEVAEFLRVSSHVVRGIIHEGGLQAVQLGERGSYRVAENILHKTFETERPLLTVDEVAALIQIHPNTLKKYAREERIGSFRIGSWRVLRFRQEDIEAFAMETD